MIRENQYLDAIENTVRLELQTTFIGRETELEAIKMQFDTVLQGHSAVTVITGDIGIGKTALVKTVLTDLSGFNTTCVYGKFEQYKDNEPYIAIIQIIESITNHILTLPKEKLDRISKKFINQSGKDGALLTEIVPQIASIIGRQGKTKVVDYQKLKIRLEAAFQTFISVAAEELYPLIIAVDDLQWADKPSWDIIKAIHDPLNKHDLYIILAYRNNLEEYQTRVKSMLYALAGNEHIFEINLESLSCQDFKAMLGDVFNGDIENVNRLVRLIHRRTMGNPFHLKQMINLLLDNQELCYHSPKGIWRLESEDVRTLNFPGDIEDVINRKIDSLNQQTKGFLEILACIGSRFSMELLGKVMKDKNGFMEENLQVLSRAGLIMENLEHPGKGRTRQFEFFHDRIHQNVYERINPGRREELHFDLAMELLKDPDRNYVAENILSITAHLLNCKGVIKREGIGDRLTTDLYFAGLKAKQSAAVEHALKLFSLGEELLDEACWRQDYDNTLKIKLALAQSEYICGRYDASEAHFQEMLTHATGQEERAEIKKQYMILNSYTGEHARVIDLGIQALQHLGFKINRQKLKMQIAGEILHGMLLFRDSRLMSIQNAPIVTDKKLVNALDIFWIMAASANLTDENLWVLIGLKISNLSAKHGNFQYSPAAYATYSLLQGSMLGNYKKAKKLSDISLRLAELFDDDRFGCATYFCLGTFVTHWTSPAKESLKYLQKAFDCGLKAGDYLFCGFSISTTTEMKYSMGQSLYELEKFLSEHKKYAQKMAHDLLLRSINIFEEHISILTSSDASTANGLIGDREMEALATNEVMIYYLLKIQRMYLDGKIEEAYNLLQKSIKQLDSIMGYIIQADFVFYFLLVSLERMKSQKGSVDKRQQRACRKFRKKLQAWAELSPENHWGKHLLVEALHMGLDCPKYAAAGLYDAAIEHAGEHHNLPLEALGNYLAAGYFSDNRKIATVYAREACRLFNEWGAVKAADRIAMLYELNDYLAASQVSAAAAVDERPENNGRGINMPDEEMLKDRQKELEALDLEAAFKYFLDAVCREAEADFGAILLEHQDQIRLEYVRHHGQPAVRYPVGVDP